MSKQDEEILSRSFKEGMIQPLIDLTERLKTEQDLREKVAESRYTLTQKRFDILEDKADRILKELEEK